MKKPIGTPGEAPSHIEHAIQQLVAAALPLSEIERADIAKRVEKLLFPPKRAGAKRRLVTVRNFIDDRLFNVAVKELIKDPATQKSSILAILKPDLARQNTITEDGLKSRLNAQWKRIRRHALFAANLHNASYQINQAMAAGFPFEDEEPIDLFLSRWAAHQLRDGF